MATFLVERYGPGIHPAAARSLDRQLAALGARIIQTIVTEVDEVTFWYVEAGSAADVRAGFRAAEVPLDRITAARGLERA
jgi:hypothetical protein